MNEDIEQLEIKNFHIMTFEEYDKYILSKINSKSDDQKKALLERFTPTKEKLLNEYGDMSFIGMFEFMHESSLTPGDRISIMNIPVVLLTKTVAMIFKGSIRDEVLYDEEDLEDWNGDNIYDFLNEKLTELMLEKWDPATSEFDDEEPDEE